MSALVDLKVAVFAHEKVLADKLDELKTRHDILETNCAIYQAENLTLNSIIRSKV